MIYVPNDAIPLQIWRFLNSVTVTELLRVRRDLADVVVEADRGEGVTEEGEAGDEGCVILASEGGGGVGGGGVGVDAAIGGAGEEGVGGDGSSGGGNSFLGRLRGELVPYERDDWLREPIPGRCEQACRRHEGRRR